MEEFENVNGLTIPVDMSSCSLHLGLPRVPKIPRPPNAFMLFANEWRRNIAQEFPELNNKEVSVKLGLMWKSLAKSGKEYYFCLARKADVQHKIMYPDYVYNPKEARIRKFLREKCRNSQCKAQRNRKQKTRKQSRKTSSLLRTFDSSGAEESLVEAYLPVLSAHNEILNLSESDLQHEDVENYTPNIEYLSETSLPDIRDKDFSEFFQGIVNEEGPRVIVAPAFSESVNDFRSERSHVSLKVAENEEIVIADLDGPNWYPFNMSGQIVAPSDYQSNDDAVGNIFGLSKHTPLQDESWNTSVASTNMQEATNIYTMNSLGVKEFMSVNDNLEIGYILDHDFTERVSLINDNSAMLHENMLNRGNQEMLAKYARSTHFPETITSDSILQNLPLFSLQTNINDVKGHGIQSSTHDGIQCNEVGNNDTKTGDWIIHFSPDSPKQINNRQKKSLANIFQDTDRSVSVDLSSTNTPCKISSPENICFGTSDVVYPNVHMKDPLDSPFKDEYMSVEFPTDSECSVTLADNLDVNNLSPFSTVNPVETFDSQHSCMEEPIGDSEDTFQSVKNTEYLNESTPSSGHVRYLTKMNCATKDFGVFLMEDNESSFTSSDSHSPKLDSTSKHGGSNLSSDLEHQKFMETLKSSVNLCFSRGQPLILRRRSAVKNEENGSQKKTSAQERGKLLREHLCSNTHSVNKSAKECSSPKRTAGEKISYIVNKIVNRDLREKEVSSSLQFLEGTAEMCSTVTENCGRESLEKNTQFYKQLIK